METCLQRLGDSYQGCEDEISELVYQINKLLEEKRSEWEESYNNLLESHNTLNKSVSEYKLCIADRDAEISDLRKELSVIDKSNYERRLVLESKINELSQTVANLKSKTISPRPPSSPNSLELTVSALKKESEYYKDKIAELEVVQSTHNTQIQLLEEQRTGLLKKNEEQRQKFIRCRKEYQSKVETATSELDRLGRLKSEHEGTISSLREEVEAKEEEIRAAKDSLEDVLSSNHRNNSAFSNMKSTLSQLQSEKASLTSQIAALTSENSRLIQERESYECKISYSERSVENVTCSAQKEIALLQGQVEVHARENEFLRGMLMAREQAPVLERLEADNNSLKDNIQAMEAEIANLIRVSREGSGGGSGEVGAVRERYERHLAAMKAEVEQLRLENLSLKVAHGGASIIGGGSTFSSLILPSAMEEEEERLEPQSCGDVTIRSDVTPPPSEPRTPQQQRVPPPATPSKSPSFDSPRSSVRSKATPLSSPAVAALASPSVTLASPSATLASPSATPGVRTPANSAVLREFEELQSRSLRQFEERLNECVASFTATSHLVARET